jgi:hypothetical protein
VLGLDRLAKEKREAAAAAAGGESDRKRQRLDDGNPRFKGALDVILPVEVNF